MGRHVTPLWHINEYSDSGQSLFLLACFNSREATNTNFIVFGLTRLGLYPMDLTPGENANHYTTDEIGTILSTDQ